MKKRKVGTFCYATDQGLGYLAKSFYDAGVVTDVMPVLHGSRPNHDEWYPGVPWVGNLRSNVEREKMVAFAKSLDTLLVFETPFWWPVMDYAKRAGVRTVLMPMYECMPESLSVTPDLVLAPSSLDRDYYPGSVFIPVPVEDSIRSQWRLRKTAEVFVHNAGHGGLHGRNGTAELLEALQYVKGDLTVVLRAQEGQVSNHNRGTYPYGSNVKIIKQYGTRPREELYADGDVFLFPEKFNGLSLPLQEAFAAGMAVMGTRRYPMTTWLPDAPLIPTRGAREDRIGGCNRFSSSIVHPIDIAAKIDEWAGKDISALSEAGKAWAEENCWEKLKPRYLEVL